MARSPIIDPSWARSIAIVRRFDEHPCLGSGVFLSPTSVITAAHVVFAPNTPLPSVACLQVEAPKLRRRCAVRAVHVHPRWRAEGALDADYALLDVSPAPGLGLPVRWDYGASGDSVQVSRYGYPTDDSARFAVGHIHRAGNMFYSSNLRVPHGASGGALVDALNGRVVLVGITTFSGDGGSDAAFIGLPMLQSARDAMRPAPGEPS
jgi:hypothetical protein